eukprot:CAMPEP_0202458454 /NCGR_PEP_ID=MMETSP1360-20130828/25501_1 /ASSEMBLY_ACC=CAM_ASM_000848 /TAXON_ID=515479 /ORGANISM="Licmophora paradoxa, Strain CCMP2313" /LENGTH=32 /DNA_ID= /DNA_START= /DNA_END= /DNA_ORIENTATION=
MPEPNSLDVVDSPFSIGLSLSIGELSNGVEKS